MEKAEEKICSLMTKLLEHDSCLAHQKCATRVVTLASLDLVAVPKSLYNLYTLEEVFLDYNELTDLPAELCSSLKHLKLLSVIGNPISSLPDEIGLLRHLEELRLNDCELADLPASLSDLRQLKVLNITGNQLRELPHDFGDLSSLQSLYADENKITCLPDSFSHLTSLSVLDIEHNKISCLPQMFGELKNLRVLNLGHNQIENLPKSFGDLSSLETLDLSHNRLKGLPDYMKSAKCLKKIYCETCGLECAPNWINNLENLEELILRNNHLKFKPFNESFSTKSSKLRILDISGNFVSSLPENIGELKKLEEIHMGSVICELERRNFQNGNWISRLPESFGELTSLKIARLDENQFSKLPDSFGNLKNLEFFDIGQNKLVELPDSFGSLSSLKICQLSKNHLERLPESFGNLESLVELRLDNNQISALPTSLSKLTQLKTLDLFNNCLTVMPPCLKDLINVNRLDLDENELDLAYWETPALHFRANYVARDPTKKSWRGRKRQDIIDVEIKQIEVEKDEKEIEEVVAEEPQYNPYLYKLAMERNLSMWRSHNGPSKREKYERPDLGKEKRQMEEALKIHEIESLDDNWEVPSPIVPLLNTTKVISSTEYNISALLPEPEEDWGSDCIDIGPVYEPPAVVPEPVPYYEYYRYSSSRDMNLFYPSQFHAASLSRSRSVVQAAAEQFADDDSE